MEIVEFPQKRRANSTARARNIGQTWLTKELVVFYSQNYWVGSVYSAIYAGSDFIGFFL